jgi:hypothetical protein
MCQAKTHMRYHIGSSPRAWCTLLLSVAVLSSAPGADQGPSTELRAGRPGQSPPAKAASADPTAWPDAKTIADRRRSSENRRLFRSDEPVAITLTANFRSVNNDRVPNSTKLFPATIEFARPNGAAVSVPLQIRGRGHARRQICSFVPLRLELPKEQTRDTVLDGHGPLKLGTHCSNSYEEIIVREYAIYRLYNLLTPRSFRARLVKATYVDAASKKPITTRQAMFIEDDDDVAKRLDGRIVDLQKVTFNRVDAETVLLMSLFEYMIGNTDMSMFLQHNVRLVQTQAGQRYTVPYDFDYAGLVDAPYAIPGSHFGLGSVRDRLYLGPCRTAPELEPFFARMRAVKAEAMALYDTLPGLSDKYRTEAKEYLERFYRTIDRPGDIKRAFIDNCNNRPYM